MSQQVKILSAYVKPTDPKTLFCSLDLQCEPIVDTGLAFSGLFFGT
jgi:hypothetical protein